MTAAGSSETARRSISRIEARAFVVLSMLFAMADLLELWLDT
jgi:hypothetical protein